MKTKLGNGNTIWHNKSKSVQLLINGMIYVWLLDIGQFSISWERKEWKS